MPLVYHWTVIVKMLLDNRFVHWKCPVEDYDRNVFVRVTHVRCYHLPKMYGNYGNIFVHLAVVSKSKRNNFFDKICWAPEWCKEWNRSIILFYLLQLNRFVFCRMIWFFSNFIQQCRSFIDHSFCFFITSDIQWTFILITISRACIKSVAFVFASAFK